MRYLGSHISSAGGVSQVPLRAKEIPVNTVQFFAKNNNQWLAKKPIDAKVVEAYFKNKKECGIGIAFSHAGYLINLASPDRENHALSLRSFAQEIELGNLLRLDFVVLHPGSHVGTGVDTGIARIAESINRVFSLTGEVHPTLLLENTAGQGSAIGHRFEELAAILDKIEAKEKVGICFDTCHGFAAGYDQRVKKDFDKTWREFDRTIGLKKLKAIHLNDSKKPLGSRVDRHDHIGRGEMGDDPFCHLMLDKRFEKIPMVLETPKHDDFVRYDRMNLERLGSFWQEAL